MMIPFEYRQQEELDAVVGNHVRAKKQYDTWDEEDEAGYQLYLQEQDMEQRTYRAWYLIANPRKLPKEIVQQELEFRFKLFPEKKTAANRKAVNNNKLPARTQKSVQRP